MAKYGVKHVQRHNDWQIILILSCPIPSSIPTLELEGVMESEKLGIWRLSKPNQPKPDLLKFLKQFEGVYELF